MNVDPEDSWLAIAAGISVSLFGLCLFGTIVRKYCRRTRMKESRSDNDLTQLTVGPSEEQYA
jgi:hypothetical protein